MTKSELLQEIQQVAQKKMTVLHFGGKGLTELPQNLGNWRNCKCYTSVAINGPSNPLTGA